MDEAIRNLPDSVKICIIFILGWFAKNYLEDRKLKQRDQETALNACTTAILRLELQMKSLNDTLLLLPKLTNDVNSAHEKIRALEHK